MEFSDDQMAALRKRLGVADDAELTGEQILAALGEEPGRQAAAAALPAGVIAIDQDVWDRTQERIRDGEAARRQQLLTERDQHIQAAIAAGKFPAGRREHWERIWAADPEGTKTVLAGLTPGVVPLSDIGTAAGPETELLDEEYRRLFPPSYTSQPES